MSKFGKIVSALAIVLVSMLTLVSCGGDDEGYNFEEDWANHNVELPDDHIFEVISLDKANEKINNGETFILFYGTSDSQYAGMAADGIQKMQDQAEYLGFDGTVYYINITDYNSMSGREEVREKLNIPDMDTLNDVNSITLVCCLYVDGNLEFGTYDGSLDDELELFGRENNEGYIVFEALAQYLFVDLKELGVL
ncbi:MAG: hypothetical protein IJY14_00525 [Acholeplasmatales bacterium]|nr:hypothetical protein [Acholeplasmatales bacterium]